MLTTVYMLVCSVLVAVATAQYVFNVQNNNVGNYYFALTNSIAAAHQCASTCIVRQPRANAVFQSMGEIVVPREADVSLAKVPIVGSFYRYAIANKTAFAFRAPTMIERIESMCPYIDSIRNALPLLGEPLRDTFSDEFTLVAHIRSGDIFGTLIHKRYWQPPLGFYQFAAHNYAKIAICSQNRQNPVVDALYEYCVTTRGKDNCLLRVGTPLRDDVAFMLRARNLAIGYGTFGVTMYAMSARIARLYYPASTIEYLGRPLASSDALAARCGQTRTIVGVCIGYNVTQVTGGRPWLATAEQRAALLLNSTQLQGLGDLHNEQFY